MLMGKIWCLEQPGNDVHSRAVLIRLKLFFHGDGKPGLPSLTAHLQASQCSLWLGARVLGPHESVGGVIGPVR